MGLKEASEGRRKPLGVLGLQGSLVEPLKGPGARLYILKPYKDFPVPNQGILSVMKALLK